MNKRCKFVSLCFTCWVKYTRNAELDNLISVFVDSTPKLFNNVTVRLLKAYFQYNIDTYLTKPGTISRGVIDFSSGICLIAIRWHR